MKVFIANPIEVEKPVYKTKVVSILFDKSKWKDKKDEMIKWIKSRFNKKNPKIETGKDEKYFHIKVARENKKYEKRVIDFSKDKGIKAIIELVPIKVSEVYSSVDKSYTENVDKTDDVDYNTDVEVDRTLEEAQKDLMNTVRNAILILEETGINQYLLLVLKVIYALRCDINRVREFRFDKPLSEQRRFLSKIDKIFSILSKEEIDDILSMASLMTSYPPVAIKNKFSDDEEIDKKVKENLEFIIKERLLSSHRLEYIIKHSKIYITFDRRYGIEMFYRVDIDKTIALKVYLLNSKYGLLVFRDKIAMYKIKKYGGVDIENDVEVGSNIKVTPKVRDFIIQNSELPSGTLVKMIRRKFGIEISPTTVSRYRKGTEIEIEKDIDHVESNWEEHYKEMKNVSDKISRKAKSTKKKSSSVSANITDVEFLAGYDRAGLMSIAKAGDKLFMILNNTGAILGEILYKGGNYVLKKGRKYIKLNNSKIKNAIKNYDII